MFSKKVIEGPTLLFLSENKQYKGGKSVTKF